MLDTPNPLSVLLPALSRALLDTPWERADLAPLADSGLAHHHVALVGHGVLARIPKQSQLRLDASANLASQSACFDRAGASGHTPRLRAVIDPREGLPRGALIVEHIVGRPAELPRDLPAIATALARIHALPVPDESERAPLGDDVDPLLALVREIGAQSAYLDAARLDPRTHALIDGQIAALEALTGRPDRPSRHLIAFDAHPGNFIIRPDGSAVLVDLEKCRYSYPSLDLAHATLYTSTTWEPGSTTVLSTAELGAFLETWTAVSGASGGAAGADIGRSGRAVGADAGVADGVAGADSGGPGAPAGQPEGGGWHAPLRRAMWLWSATWSAKWRVLSGSAPTPGADGEDWAAANSTDALSAHVRERVSHYLDPEVVQFIVGGFDELDELELEQARDREQTAGPSHGLSSETEQRFPPGLTRGSASNES